MWDATLAHRLHRAASNDHYGRQRQERGIGAIAIVGGTMLAKNRNPIARASTLAAANNRGGSIVLGPYAVNWNLSRGGEAKSGRVPPCVPKETGEVCVNGERPLGSREGDVNHVHLLHRMKRGM